MYAILALMLSVVKCLGGNSLSVFLGDLLRDVVVDGGAGTVEGDAVPQRDLEEPGDHEDQVPCVTQRC